MTCPHCGASINEGFRYCSSCSRLAVYYKLCQKCREPIADEAEICPHCSSRNKKPTTDKSIETESLEITATRWGAFFGAHGFTGLFHPPTVKLHDGRVTITKWSFWGMAVDTQEVLLSNVASVRYSKGVFWGGLLIETLGGASEDIYEHGMKQYDAQIMVKLIKQYLQN